MEDGERIDGGGGAKGIGTVLTAATLTQDASL